MANRDTQAHRAVARLGWIFAALGVLGLVFWRDLYILWVAMIAFGLAYVPGQILRWWRSRRPRT